MKNNFEEFLEEVKIGVDEYKNFAPAIKVSIISKYIQWVQTQKESK